jgi:membrane protein
MSVQCFWQVCKKAAVSWNDDAAPTLGAALAYYTAFSLAPLLLIAVSIASLVVSESEARAGILRELKQTLGPDTGAAFVTILDDTNRAGGHAVVTAVGLATLLLGASGVFVQLQDSFNIIWKTQALPRTDNAIVHFLRNRLLSFTAVLGTGFLLLVSLIASSVLAALNDWLGSQTLLGNSGLWQALSMLVSTGFITLMFALLFKLLPDVHVAWGDVGIGALMTAGLFVLGQYLIGLYLGKASVASAWGAAGSLAVLLVWVYYSAQIVLFGAEFTHAFAEVCGSRATQRVGEPNRGQAAAHA